MMHHLVTRGIIWSPERKEKEKREREKKREIGVNIILLYVCRCSQKENDNDKFILPNSWIHRNCDLTKERWHFQAEIEYVNSQIISHYMRIFYLLEVILLEWDRLIFYNLLSQNLCLFA